MLASGASPRNVDRRIVKAQRALRGLSVLRWLDPMLTRLIKNGTLRARSDYSQS